MYSENFNICEYKDIHAPTCSNHTHIHETHSIGLVFYTQTVNIMTFNFFVYVNIYPSHCVCKYLPKSLYTCNHYNYTLLLVYVNCIIYLCIIIF